jgi:hypothetical protein
LAWTARGLVERVADEVARRRIIGVYAGAVKLSKTAFSA